LNYRHAFHAGNFADLVKHACLTAALTEMVAGGPPIQVIDTHAGAGLYDLGGEDARRTAEAERGVYVLLADPKAPAVFGPLKAQIAKLNGAKDARLYPGSPLLAQTLLRKADTLIACELRPEEAGRLRAALKGTRAEVLIQDGFATGPRVKPGQPTLVLIDPPFERADDYDQIVKTTAAVLRRNRGATVMAWTPLKDLETFDGYLRKLEQVRPPATLVIEARLRPLDDPMRMNGCALVVVNPPPGLEAQARAACDWVVAALGTVGGGARVWGL
jgi:23S rRNA (adenine2030-N6)-methyltransferase